MSEKVITKNVTEDDSLDMIDLDEIFAAADNQSEKSADGQKSETEKVAASEQEKPCVSRMRYSAFDEITLKRFLLDIDKCRRPNDYEDWMYTPYKTPSKNRYIPFHIIPYDYSYESNENYTDKPYHKVRSLLGIIYDNKEIIESEDPEHITIDGSKIYILNKHRAAHSGSIICSGQFDSADVPSHSKASNGSTLWVNQGINIWVPENLINQLIYDKTEQVYITKKYIKQSTDDYNSEAMTEKQFTTAFTKAAMSEKSKAFKKSYMFKDFSDIVSLITCPEIELTADTHWRGFDMYGLAEPWIHPECGITFTFVNEHFLDFWNLIKDEIL